MDTIEFSSEASETEGLIKIDGNSISISYPAAGKEFEKEIIGALRICEFEDYKGIRVGEDEEGNEMFHPLSYSAIQRIEELAEKKGYRVNKTWEESPSLDRNIEDMARESALGGETATEREFRNGTDYNDPTPRRPEGGTYH